MRLCGIFFHSKLVKHMHKTKPRAASARPGKVLGQQVPVQEGFSSQEPRVRLGEAALGSHSWPKTVFRARCWGQQGCHRAHRDKGVSVTLGRGTALSDFKMT